MLEANLDYWNPERFPRVQRIVFDNTLSQKDAIELVKTREGKVDLVSELRPLDTLRVAQSPFAKVVKARQPLRSVFGQFNMRQTGSPWRDVRLRRAVNLAINRENLIRYAAKGNGVIIPALLSQRSFGHDPTLAPYPFEPSQAQRLLREAGYPPERPVVLIAPQELEVQATVIRKMLEHVGFTVDRQILDGSGLNSKTRLGHLDQPAEEQRWDIALRSFLDVVHFPLYLLYQNFLLDGAFDWAVEQPELRQLYERALYAVDEKQREALMRQMERHTHDQAYLLFLYNPIQLYAVNEAVEFVPHVTTLLTLAETGVTDKHWSLRSEKGALQP